MRQTEVLRLALEALEKIAYVTAMDYEYQRWAREAITAIKAALEAKDEPAAWMYLDDLKRFETSETFAQAYSIEMVSPTQGETVPLYTTPPQRTWVGLTDEEVTWLCNTAKSHEQTWGMFVRAIEAKLKEKNT
jgi:hypothetical protein